MLSIKNEKGDFLTFGRKPPFLLSKINDSIKNKFTSTISPSGEGQKVNFIRREERYIDLKLFVVGIRLEEAKRLINSVFRLNEVLTIETENKRSIKCYLEENPSFAGSLERGKVLEVGVKLVSFSPHWLSKGKGVKIAHNKKTFKFPVSIEKKMTFGERVTKLESIVSNDGDLVSGFNVLVRAKGTCNGFYIEKVDDNKRITVNHGFISGDIMRIVNNEKVKSITINNENALGKLDMTSKFFSLDRGANTIRFGSSDDNAVNLEVIITFDLMFFDRG